MDDFVLDGGRIPLTVEASRSLLDVIKARPETRLGGATCLDVLLGSGPVMAEVVMPGPVVLGVIIPDKISPDTARGHEQKENRHMINETTSRGSLLVFVHDAISQAETDIIQLSKDIIKTKNSGNELRCIAIQQIFAVMEQYRMRLEQLVVDIERGQPVISECEYLLSGRCLEDLELSLPNFDVKQLIIQHRQKLDEERHQQLEKERHKQLEEECRKQQRREYLESLETKHRQKQEKERRRQLAKELQEQRKKAHIEAAKLELERIALRKSRIAMERKRKIIRKSELHKRAMDVSEEKRKRHQNSFPLSGFSKCFFDQCDEQPAYGTEADIHAVVCMDHRNPSIHTQFIPRQIVPRQTEFEISVFFSGDYW